MFVRTFVKTFYYGSGTVIYYGSSSGSNFLTSNGSGSGSTRQKIMVPTVPVPVPQYCENVSIFCSESRNNINSVVRIHGEIKRRRPRRKAKTYNCTFAL